MAKSKKSKILASMLAVSTMAVFYATPVIAAELYEYNNDSQWVTTKGDNGTKITELEGLEEIKVGQADGNNDGLVKITGKDGEGLVRVGDSHGQNVRLAKDGVYINTNGDDKRTGLTAGTLTLAGNALTSAQLANINSVIGADKKVNASRLNLNGVAMNADTKDDTLTVGNSSLSFAKANKTITNTEAIRRVVDEEHKMSATYLEETVKAHSAFGLQVLDENGEAVATISRGGSGTFNGTVTTRDVNSNAHSVLSSAGLQLYNADGTSKVNITNTGASRFGAFDETSVRIENGQLQIRAANTAENADSSGPLLASLSEDGLTLVDDERNYFTLSATRLATINDVITEEGAVISKGDVTSKAEDGTTYTLNTVGNNTSGIASHSEGKVTTIEGAFSVNENGYIYNANGSFQVTRDGAARFGNENDNHIHMEDGVLSVKTDPNTTVASLSEDGFYVYKDDGKVAGSLTKNGLTADSINVGGGNFTVAHNGSVKAADGLFGIDTDGNVSATEFTAGGYNLTDIGEKTQGIDHYANDTTYYKGAISATGSVMAGGMGNEAIIGGNTEDGGYLSLKDSNDEYQTLTASKLATINNVIQEDGSVVSQGDVKSYDAENDRTNSLNDVASDLNELESNVGNIGDNVKHIEHHDDFTINGQEYDATVIEESVAITKDRGIDVIGANGASVATITRQGVARFGAESDANVRIENGSVYVNGSYNNHVASLSEDGLMLSDAANGQQTLTATKIADIQGITRTGAPEYGYTTSIEGSFRVKSDGSFGTDNDTFVVNDLGEISAANGEFFVDRNGAVTAQAGSVIGGVRFSGGGDLNDVNHINGALIEAYDADPDNGVSGLRISGVAMENGAIKVNAINGATVNYYGEGGLEISGVGMLNGDVNAKSFNGVTIENDGGSPVIGGIDLGNLNENVAAATEDIGGIERFDKLTSIDGLDTTSIEGRLVVNKEELVIGGYGEGNSLTINADGARFAGNVVFNNGYNVSFSYGADGSKGTSLGKLAEGFDNLNAKVDDIYDRTQGIDRDENGNTVISNDERTWNEETGTSKVTDNGGATITVGNDINVDGGNLNVNNGDLNVGVPGSGSGSGEGGNTGDSDGTGNGNFAGDVNVDGDANVDGSVTVGDATDGKYTQVGEGGMTVVGKDDNDNTTTNNISDKGMTITGKDDNGNTTTNNISDKGMTITGKDDNGNTTTNNISDKGMTVTGDNGTTNISGGDISVDNSVTVGSGENQTVVNNDGITVGGEEGTSIKNDSISVGDGGYIGDGDVRSGEGVSLNDTAERVGHLENRVGELEDRIDKVGAMAAAIANLRTMGYDPAAPTEVAVGIGQYRDETGAALGLFHYPNRDFMLSLSVSTSGDEVMGGIGATWKFGRKSPEKVAEIKKAQAEADARRAEEAKLAKAEEMKQAAKEAKIKAQQERHAKLAAERAAQAEAAK